MDASRLLQVLTDFVAEVNSIQLAQALGSLASNLQQSVQAPNQPSHEQQFKDGLSKLFDGLENCPSNFWTPTRRLILQNAGLADVTGLGLREKITKILTQASVLRQPILSELQRLVQEVQRKINEATQTATTLPQLGVKPAIPPSDKAEIGFLLPDAIDTARINGIERELRAIDRIIKTVAELNDEAVGSSEVVEINRGSLTVFVIASYATTRAILDIVERVLNIWQRIIDLKGQQTQLEKNGVPQEIVDVLKAHIDDRLTTESSALAREMIAQSKVEDQGRRNELEIQMRIAIKTLAVRVDHGAKIEASVALEPSRGQNQELSQEISKRGSMMSSTPQLEKPILALSLEAETPDDSEQR